MLDFVIYPATIHEFSYYVVALGNGTPFHHIKVYGKITRLEW
jgi:hypothetical protein